MYMEPFLYIFNKIVSGELLYKEIIFFLTDRKSKFYIGYNIPCLFKNEDIQNLI